MDPTFFGPGASCVIRILQYARSGSMSYEKCPCAGFLVLAWLGASCRSLESKRSDGISSARGSTGFRPPPRPKARDVVCLVFSERLKRKLRSALPYGRVPPS